MAFAYTVTAKVNISRSKKITWGTFTNGTNDVGGAITTGLTYIDFFSAGITSHVDSGDVKATTSGGTATLITGNDIDGTWMAIGQ